MNVSTPASKVWTGFLEIDQPCCPPQTPVFGKPQDGRCGHRILKVDHAETPKFLGGVHTSGGLSKILYFVAFPPSPSPVRFPFSSISSGVDTPHLNTKHRPQHGKFCCPHLPSCGGGFSTVSPTSNPAKRVSTPESKVWTGVDSFRQKITSKHISGVFCQ